VQSKKSTVAGYLASLPEDRRIALDVVRKVILVNLDPDYEEGMSYGHTGFPMSCLPPRKITWPST